MTNPEHIRIIKHSLGWPKNYRNYFASGPDADNWEMLNAMVLQGLMTEPVKYPLADDMYFFQVTEAGKGLLEEEEVT